MNAPILSMNQLPHNRKRFTLWTFFYCVMALFAATLLFVVGLLSLWSYGQAQRVDELVAEIRAKREPVTGEELAPYFALPPEVDDVTQLWLEGIQAIDNAEHRASGRELPYVGVKGEEEKSVPKMGEPWADLPACESYLDANQAALDKFHEAARRGGYARFPVDYSQGRAVALPAVSGVREAAMLLRLEFEVRAHQHDPRGAAESMRALLVLSRSLEKDPTLISLSVKIALDGLATRALADKLCLVRFSDEELLEFQQIVRANSPETCLKTAFIGERALGYSMLLRPELMGTERPSPLPPFHADKATYLTYMNGVVNASGGDLEDLYPAIRDMEQGIAGAAKSWASRWTAGYSCTLMSPVGMVWEATARELASLRSIDAAIGVELYRREKGRLPDSLSELAPKYLAAPPVDPYTGDPMIYTQSVDGFAIYGLGKNKKDDGGTFDYGKNSDDGFHFPLK